MFNKEFYWEIFRNTGRLDAYVDYVRSKEEETKKEEETEEKCDCLV